MTETLTMTPTSTITAKARSESPQPAAAAVAALPRQIGNHIPGVAAAGPPPRSRHLKQALDFLGAAFLLALTAPLFLLIAALIKLNSRGPVFFVQKRVGCGGHVFRCYKFRTMRHNSDEGPHREFARAFIRGAGDGAAAPESGGNGNGRGNGHCNGHGNGKLQTRVYKMTRDARITRVGQLLRRTSLDELPQLLNVLCGHMSLVGPRPPVVYELEHYQDWHMRRLETKPGITGLWQVSGRSSVPFDEMVQLDIYYIDHRSLLMDLWIIARTLPVMLKGDGAY
jgi:lipopolysaccharide/colanic/teichoic acid biosynthesis glycosyltransferase